MAEHNSVPTDAYPAVAGSPLRELCGIGRICAAALRRTPRAAGGLPQPAPAALLIPGCSAPDWSMARMHRHLRARGHRTFASRRGHREKCWRAQTDQLARRLAECAERSGGPVALVGHSLGGLQARMLGVRHPDLVAGVITLGAPIRGIFDLSRGGTRFAELLVAMADRGLPLPPRDCMAGGCWEATAMELEQPVAQHIPCVCLFGRFDWTVPSRAAIHPGAEPIEVAAAHCEFGVDAEVCRIVERTLGALGGRSRSAA
ncbi:esterase/lipase family protein [Nocardia sp. NPDC127526]|uniref:esterase/lipase family protein n=1 Tax=Nocardia sp. NPDC127526 TaxID=3345393 RepID=UPI003643F31D